MKCHHVIDFLPAYVDKHLPDHTADLVKQHINGCEGCHAEYTIWKESLKFFQNDGMFTNDTREHFSVVEDVMSRLAREEKWSFPITAQIFRLSSAVHKWIVSACVLLLLVFGVVLFGAVQPEPSFPSSKERQHQEWSASAIIMSMDQVQASPLAQNHASEIRHRIVASIGDPVFVDHAPASAMPNLSFVLAFFGILVTIVSMNWFSRT